MYSLSLSPSRLDNKMKQGPAGCDALSANL